MGACSHIYGVSDGREQTIGVSLFLNSLTVKNAIVLLSISILSLFLESLLFQQIRKLFKQEQKHPQISKQAQGSVTFIFSRSVLQPVRT